MLDLNPKESIVLSKPSRSKCLMKTARSKSRNTPLSEEPMQSANFALESSGELASSFTCWTSRRYSEGLSGGLLMGEKIVLACDVTRRLRNLWETSILLLSSNYGVASQQKNPRMARNHGMCQNKPAESNSIVVPNCSP